VRACPPLWSPLAWTLDNMEQQIRGANRRYLPSRVRRPFGMIGGSFDERIIQGSPGLILDLKGVCLRVGGCASLIPNDVTPQAWRRESATR